MRRKGNRGFSSPEPSVSPVVGPAASPWIDISVPLHDAMVHWPGDPPARIRLVHDLGRGDSHNLSEISLSSHAGTHIDAPRHFIREGTGIDGMPLEATVGRARVIEIFDAESIKPKELSSYRIHRGERILFKTRNSSRVWQTDKFIEDFVFLSQEAADFLVKRGVRAIGVDYLSVGGFKRGGGDVHRTLLRGGVWIIEGLDLSRVGPGKYELICLPLRLEGIDGAPARAILRPMRVNR